MVIGEVLTVGGGGRECEGGVGAERAKGDGA